MTGLLLNLNFAATAASLLILIVKYILRKKTTPRWQLLIWAVLAVQLIVFPFAEKLPESGLSLRNYLPKASVSENASLNAAELKENINDVNGGIKINADAGNTEAVQADKVLPGRGNGETSETGGGNINTGRGSKDRIIAVEMPQGKKVSVSGAVDAAITTIWICGIAVTAFIQIGRYIRCRKSVKELNVCENEKVLKTFEECKNALAIKKEISIYKGADMTMLIGIFNPKVYINESFAENELKYVLMHELCHYKNKDVLWSLAAAAYTAVFWFNPVILYSLRVFRRDVEIYCDDRAIAAVSALAEDNGLTASGRREYARVLIKSAAGQQGFVPVTTSFIGSEKEVTARIKRIAEFKKPRVTFAVVSALAALLILAACTTGARGSGMPETESVLIGMHMQADVPSSWLYDMDKDVSRIDYADGMSEDAKQFFDREGNLFAEIYVPEEMFTFEEMQTLNESSYMSDEQVQNAIIRHLESRGYLEIREAEANTNDMQTEEGIRYYAFTAKRDGKQYNIAVRTGYSFAVAAAETSISGLISCLESVRASYIWDVEETALKSVPEFQQGNYELTDSQYEKYASALLEQAFEIFENEDVPVEWKIKEHHINSIAEIKQQAGSSPKKPNVFLGAFYDDVKWDVIYPKAKAYEIDYEITPYMEEYFAGKTKEKRIALFAVNDYITNAEEADGEAQIGELYFLGFADSEDIDLFGTDSVLLDMLDRWYTGINPGFPAHYTTEYIGNAMAVGKLIASLPLHEYIDMSSGTFSDKALVLQTAEEPYGLTVNYDFTKESPLDMTDEIAMTPIDTRSRQILSSGLNAYVVRQVYTNMNRLFDGIGNLGILTVNLQYTEDGEIRTETLSFTRDDFWL